MSKSQKRKWIIVVGCFMLILFSFLLLFYPHKHNTLSEKKDQSDFKSKKYSTLTSLSVSIGDLKLPESDSYRFTELNTSYTSKFNFSSDKFSKSELLKILLLVFTNIYLLTAFSQAP